MEKIKKAKEILKNTITISYVGTSRSKYDRSSPIKSPCSGDHHRSNEQTAKSETTRSILNKKLIEIDSNFQSIQASSIRRKLFDDPAFNQSFAFEDTQVLDINCYFAVPSDVIKSEVLNFACKSKFVVQADVSPLLIA